MGIIKEDWGLDIFLEWKKKRKFDSNLTLRSVDSCLGF